MLLYLSWLESLTHNQEVVGSSPTGSTIVVNNINYKLKYITTMLKIYFFTSTKKCDNVTQISILSVTKERAIALAGKYFNKQGYKGVPKMLAV